jgi:integrase
MGRTPTASGGVTPKNDRIQIRFNWRGKEYRPTLNLNPTAGNLKSAARLREQILDEIKMGSFNLEHHFPEYKHIGKMLPAGADGTSPHHRTLSEWTDIFFEFKARTTEHSTLFVYKRHMLSYWISVWGDLNPKYINNEMVQMRLAKLAKGAVDPDGKVHRPLSRKSQNNILIPLRGVFELISKNLTNVTNPVAGIENLKAEMNPPDPFTPQEVELILQGLAKRNPIVADYYEFAMFAGLRDSEQIALLWDDVDLVNMTLNICRARVLGQSKERTKTHKGRLVELNARAAAVIERQRARTQLEGKEVFKNPFTGKAWNDDQEQRVEFRAAIRGAGVRYRPPKECRDTSVTMALMAGADPAWVAAQHGHSVITMLRSYAKWLPKGDNNRNLNKVNSALGMSNSALEPHLQDPRNQKTH